MSAPHPDRVATGAAELVRNRETFHEPPNYYNRAGYHCFDVMDAPGMFTKYYIASAFTYLWRCDFKGDEAEALRDLKKARRYNRLGNSETGETRRCTGKLIGPGGNGRPASADAAHAPDVNTWKRPSGIITGSKPASNQGRIGARPGPCFR